MPTEAKAPIERIAWRPAEFSAATGLSREKVARMIASGELASIKAGTARLIPAAAVREWMVRGTGTPA